MQTADEMLGPEVAAPKPSAESMLGPEPGAQPSSPWLDRFLNNTSVGRVLDAFGQGAKAGWGAAPLGVSPETEAALRNSGIFLQDRDLQPGEWSIAKPFRTFNEAIIRPAAFGLDAAMRAGSAGITGLANAGVQAVSEIESATNTGPYPNMKPKEPGAIDSDTLMLANTLGIVAGSRAPESAARGPLPLAEPEVEGATAAGLDSSSIPAAEAAPELSAEEAAPQANAPASAAEAAPALSTAETPRPMTSPIETFDTPASDVVDRAGNINLDRIAAPEDVKDVIRQVADQNGGFPDATRGTVPLAETEQLAQAIGMTPEKLAQRNIGQAFNAEEITAARNLLVQSAQDVRDAAAKAVGGSDDDLMAYAQARDRHAMIQEQVAGMTAEAGRALSSFRIMSGDIKNAQAFGQMLDQVGGRVPLQDEVKMISALDTPAQVSKYIMDSRIASGFDMAMEAWRNALLSGPQTHATYAVSNLLTAFSSVPETAIASAIGKVRQLLPGADEDAVAMGEANARLFGLAQGAKEGVIAGWEALKNGLPSDASRVIGDKPMEAIPSMEFDIAGQTVRLGGAQVRLPYRVIGALGEFFRAIGNRQELNAQAYRAAVADGVTGDDFAAAVADHLANPTEAMLEAARANGEYQNFTKPLGDVGQAVQNLADKSPPVKVILPFIRVPGNIIKYALERSPAAPLLEEVRDNLSGANGAVARDTQLARMVMGSAVSVAAVTLAAQGKITGGGPSDPKQRAVLRLTGWQPYSVKIGDTYYSGHRFAPWALPVFLAADMYEASQYATDKENNTLAGMLVASIAKNMVDETWLKGPADLIQAVEDPDRYGDKYIDTLGGTVVPTGVAQWAHTDDPVLRDARNLIDTIKSRVPGLSEEVLPKRDIWGEPITRNPMFGPDMLSTVAESKINNDPVNQELLKLGIFPGKLDKKIRGVTLDPQQYDDYQRVAGRLAKHNLDGIVAVPGFDDMPEYARKEIIKGTIERSHQAAESYMLMQNGGALTQAAVAARVKQITGMKSQ